MRWIEMQGPITPILHLMANYYAKNSNLESEDLIQEAWVALCSKKGLSVAVAQTAMSNALATSRSQKRLDLIYAKQLYEKATYYEKFHHLDIPVYLSRLDSVNRMIIEMLYYEDLPVKIIAQRCGLNPSTINARIKKAIALMRGKDIVVVQTTRFSRPRYKRFKKISKYYGGNSCQK